MKKLIIGLMAVGLVGMMGLPVMAATSDTADIYLLVTPITNVDLTITTTNYYDFGSVDLEVSTYSATGITLKNSGNVGITVEKAVWDDGEWDITLSSTVNDGFDLWAMANATIPGGLGDFETAKSSFSKSGAGAYAYMNDLTDSGGVAVEMDAEATENIWFRLDMPKYTTTNDQKTIQVRILGIEK